MRSPSEETPRGFCEALSHCLATLVVPAGWLLMLVGRWFYRTFLIRVRITLRPRADGAPPKGEAAPPHPGAELPGSRDLRYDLLYTRNVVRAAGGESVAAAAIALGIDTYPGQPLRGCAADAEKVAETFRARWGDGGLVLPLRNGLATADNLALGLRAAARAVRPGGTVYLFFSGHGATDRGPATAGHGR